MLASTRADPYEVAGTPAGMRGRVDDGELRRITTASGIRGEGLPSFEQVEHRRFELWLVSTVLLVGITGALGLLTTLSPDQMHTVLLVPGVRYGAFGFALAMSIYSIEKERHLRRISRVLTSAMSSRLHEITTLLDVGRAVNSTLELDRVLASMLAGAADLMPATTGSVMLLDGTELQVAAAVGNEGALGRRGAVGKGIAGHVAQTMTPLLLNGPADASSFPGLAARRTAVGSALCVPLIDRSELLGVLNLSSPEIGQFTDYDLRALCLFAEHAAAAISKARLYARSQQLAAELAHAATHDSLTGLGNRMALHNRANGTQALLFLDLDGFKQVNDRYGHAAGDQVLVAVARRISANVAARDVVVRLGGDEFAILLEGVDDELLAVQIGDRVRAAIDRPINVGTTRLRVTGSVGVAVPSADNDSLDGLLRHADVALYAAKAAGKAHLAAHPAIPAQRSVPSRAGN